MERRPTFWTVLGAIALFVVCLGSVGLLTPSMGSPGLTAPASLALVLPLFQSKFLGLAAFVAWPLGFLLWARPLLRGSGRFPARTFVAWAVVLVLSVFVFLIDWRFALEYPGAAFTWGCLGLSLMMAAGVLILGLRCRREPSFIHNLAAHWLLFAWVVTYAFPYLGETP